MNFSHQNTWLVGRSRKLGIYIYILNIDRCYISTKIEGKSKNFFKIRYDSIENLEDSRWGRELSQSASSKVKATLNMYFLIKLHVFSCIIKKKKCFLF